MNVGESPVATVIAILAIITAFASQASAQTNRTVNVQERLHISAEASTIVDRWSEATGIRVMPDAKEKILAGFSDEQPRLREAFAKQGLESDQRIELTQALVEQYLYDLRDFKLTKLLGEVPLIRPQNAPLRFDFQQERQLVIDIKDVLAFPPTPFLNRLGLILDSKVGFLEVLSVPEGARIRIDGDNKEQFTCRRFVVSPGDHYVEVFKSGTTVKCSEKVSVAPQDTASVRCPKAEKVKCRLPKK